MACKKGVCSRKNKPGQFTTEVHNTKDDSYSEGYLKGSTDARIIMEGIISDQCQDGYKYGYDIRFTNDRDRYIALGILIGGIVAVILLSFFL
jgi:hypothetical protein